MSILSASINRAITAIKTPFRDLLKSTCAGVKLTRHLSTTKPANMKLVQFKYCGKHEVRVGCIIGNDCIVDFNQADPSLPCSLIEILKKDLQGCLERIICSNPKTTPLSNVILTAPITNMDKVLCIGLNYKDHCSEQNLEPPKVPIFFSKFPSCVVGPDEPVKIRTDVTKCVDWEVELCVVIGKKCSNIKPEDVYKYVLGYTVSQDISARDWQKDRNGGQFLLGKAMDSFCPIGPWIVTTDEITDPQCLDIKCSVNGEVKQSSNTCQLIHKIPDAIARLSSVMTLLPGDIILTGTAGGVGMYRKPPQYLVPGSKIVSEIEKIGCLETVCTRFDGC